MDNQQLKTDSSVVSLYNCWLLQILKAIEMVTDAKELRGSAQVEVGIQRIHGIVSGCRAGTVVELCDKSADVPSFHSPSS